MTLPQEKQRMGMIILWRFCGDVCVRWFLESVLQLDLEFIFGASKAFSSLVPCPAPPKRSDHYATHQGWNSTSAQC